VPLLIKNAGKSFGKFGGKLQSGFGGIIGKFGGGAINFGSKIGNRLNNFGNDVVSTTYARGMIICYLCPRQDNLLLMPEAG
jgi:hypothetical protein